MHLRLARPCLIAVAAMASAAAPAATLRLPPSSGHVITVEVNGHPLRLRVDPGGFAEVILNPAAAKRAQLRSSVPLIGMVGPVKLRGRSARGQMAVGGSRSRPRFIWFDRNATEGVDGIISPWLLPYDQVDLELSAARNGQTIALPIRFESQLGIFSDQRFDGVSVPIRATLLEERTTATAAAGALIAAHRSGTWDGPTIPYRVRWGVERPIRPLRLGRPLAIGRLELQRVLVRTSDFRGNYRLPNDPAADPSEIVVTGKRKGQRALLVMTLARDVLSRCSLIRFTRKPRQLSFTC